MRHSHNQLFSSVRAAIDGQPWLHRKHLTGDTLSETVDHAQIADFYRDCITLLHGWLSNVRSSLVRIM